MAQDWTIPPITRYRMWLLASDHNKTWKCANRVRITSKVLYVLWSDFYLLHSQFEKALFQKGLPVTTVQKGDQKAIRKRNKSPVTKVPYSQRKISQENTIGFQSICTRPEVPVTISHISSVIFSSAISSAKYYPKTLTPTLNLVLRADS